jgi:hypothetical protein
MFEVSPLLNTNYYLTGTAGANAGSDSIAIKVNALPTVTVNPAVRNIVSATNTVLTASGATSYVWTPNSFIVSGQNTSSLTVSPTVSTAYTATGTDANGCMGSGIANLNIPSGNLTAKMIRSTTSDTLCQGQSMTINARRILPSNQTPTKVVYTITPMTHVTKQNDTTFEITPVTTTKYFLTGIDENNNSGLDSINIIVNPIPTVTVSPASAYVQLGNSVIFTASGGGNYTWSPSTYVTADTISAALAFTPTNFINYEVEVRSANGCIDYMEVPVGVYTLRTVSANSCKSYDWGGKTYTLSGSYKDSFEASNGIDSIVTLNLTIQNTPILAAPKTDTTATIPYLWRGKLYQTSGTYRDTVVSALSCDSIYELKLTVDSSKLPPAVFSNAISACDSFIWRKKTYKQTGTYMDTVFNATRDTVFVLNIVVNRANTSVTYSNGEFVSGCIGCLYQWYVCNGTSRTPIQNATAKTYKTKADSSYSVNVSYGICTGKSACVNKKSVSVISGYSNDVIVFPNPTRDIIQISTDKVYENLLITLTDLMGRIILSQSFKNSQDVELNVEKLSQGNYIIQINDGLEIKSRLKLTKE